MSVGYSTTLRNARLDAITTAIGASGLLRIYDGTRPASGGTATTLLAQLTLSATFAPAAAAGVLTANAIGSDTSADATGTATWARLTTSAGAFVADMGVGTSGQEVTLNTVSIVIAGTVACTSLQITAGNP
tara:strand:- start:410 stop:802 length:393 start_codon:yes stop_codon:yes gene_type:complete